MPREFLDDGYGSIDDKTESLKARVVFGVEAGNCIALSLCSLLAGDLDAAVEYHVSAKSGFSISPVFYT